MTADLRVPPPSWRFHAEGWLQRLGPVRAAFAGSSLLSLLALQKSTLNRDGMLYVEAARAFLAQGLDAAMQIYPWPLLSVLMAGISQVTGLGLETGGHLLNLLFMAGACALLVACAARTYPEAAWPVCLVVLALPGLNGYRDELLREYGAWFFTMLSLWLALRWADTLRWPTALAAQAALAAAALFRPECLALFVALALWQCFSSPAGQRGRHMLALTGLPALAGVALLLFVAADPTRFGRLAVDLERLALAQFTQRVLDGIAAEPGRAPWVTLTITALGSLALVPLKFFTKMGLFIVPLLHAATGRAGRTTLTRGPLFVWAFAVHCAVLGFFALEMQFLAGRYLGPLLLFAAPLTGLGLLRLCERFPRWKTALISATLLMALHNVIDLDDDKRYFIAAGQWLAQNAGTTPQRLYIESGRAAYYAGWPSQRLPAPDRRAEQEAAILRHEYDWVVLEVSRQAPPVEPWIEKMGLREVKRFGTGQGDAVVITRPAS